MGYYFIVLQCARNPRDNISKKVKYTVILSEYWTIKKKKLAFKGLCKPGIQEVFKMAVMDSETI